MRPTTATAKRRSTVVSIDTQKDRVILAAANVRDWITRFKPTGWVLALEKQ
ncbi:hypothetical protein yfred0001_41620 [Yersinia frederiksenii ATCC 33641]|nr:hypothetical protein yfred0001_41620 [Yersinia frederiksenii ATCC 33641]